MNIKIILKLHQLQITKGTILEHRPDLFARIKEDFILLYSDDYVKNVQDELLNLEIELLIEKIAELISCYHMQLQEKKMENILFQNDYNSNASHIIYKNTDDNKYHNLIIIQMLLNSRK